MSKFMIIWGGQAISSLGYGLTAFSLGIYIFQLTQSAGSFAMLALCSFLPSLLLDPLAGVLADRFKRLKLMIVGDLGSALCLGTLIVLFLLEAGKPGLPMIYALTTLRGIFAALQATAYKSSITDLLPADLYCRASGLVQLSGSAQYLLAPVVAGFLADRVEIATVLLINCGTYFLACAATYWAAGRVGDNSNRSGSDQMTFRQEFFEGWKVVTGHRGIKTLTLIMSFATYFVGLLQSLLGPMLMSISDSMIYGGITSFAASGLILGSAIISLTKSGNHWKQLIFGLWLSGVFLSLLGLSGKLSLIAAAGFLFFSSLPLVNTGAEVLIRTNISNRLQGRAWGLIGLISQLGYIAAYVSAGPLAEGLVSPLFTEGGALAGSIGKVIGLDPSSGIRFIFILSGCFIVLLSLMSSRNKALQLLSSPSRA